jgi:delta-aminolevulinic acid dehydratase/porphobilinogen synthase
MTHIYFHRLGLKSFVLFPNIEDNLKTENGDEALNPAGLVPKAIKAIKDAFPDTCVITDVALDPYSSMVSVLICNVFCGYGGRATVIFVV